MPECWSLFLCDKPHHMELSVLMHNNKQAKTCSRPLQRCSETSQIHTGDAGQNERTQKRGVGDCIREKLYGKYKD